MQKNNFFLKRINFLLFKIFLWISFGLLFMSISILIPAGSDSMLKEFIVFLCLAIVVNIHISYLHPIISKKSKWGYAILLIASVFICALIEMLIFLEQLELDITSSMVSDRRKLYFVIFGYIFIRDFAVFIFFFWVEHFNRLIHLLYEKEKNYQKEITLLIEKQEFERKFSRKKLLSHYFFNVLEHLNPDSLIHHSDSELLGKVKFILYYFLVDAEKEKVELDKELAFYKYYIELENLKRQKDITVNFTVLGKVEDYTLIPLLFEPLIGNAMKYTKQDGTGRVDIEFDATQFPVLTFRCKNNYGYRSSHIVSSENGLKILEQRLELCYKNNFMLKITQKDDLYEVLLSITVS